MTKIVKEVKVLKKKSVNNVLLLLTALIWGAAFVAQSVGMDYIGPFTFNCVRSILGGIVLIPLIYILDKQKKRNTSKVEEVEPNKKTLAIGGICCGIFLMLGSSLQQIGIPNSSPRLQGSPLPQSGSPKGQKGSALNSFNISLCHYLWLSCGK